MSTTLTGADADELERIASLLRVAADDLDGHAGSVTTTLRSVAWVGGVATRFGASWNGIHRPRIRATAHSVRDAAARLDRNAAEQRSASHGRTGVGPAVQSPAPSDLPSAGSGPDERRDVAERADGVLRGLGLAHAQIETIADLAERLAGHGEVDRLVDLLTADSFRAFLEGADHVFDAGSVIVDAVADFADHPGLQFDERIVHALADTSVRLGVDQGMEFAAEWLAGAATIALLPGFGAILAPLVGDLAGAVAGEVVDVAVDAIDDATDVVDAVADAAVAVYRDMKDVIGLVTDVAEAAVEVVGGAVDLADAGIDAGAVLVDLGGALVSSGLDVAGGAFGALDPFD